MKEQMTWLTNTSERKEMALRNTTSMHLVYDVFGKDLAVCEESEATIIKRLTVTMMRLVKSSSSSRKVKMLIMLKIMIGMKVVTK